MGWNYSFHKLDFLLNLQNTNLHTKNTNALWNNFQTGWGQKYVHDLKPDHVMRYESIKISKCWMYKLYQNVQSLSVSKVKWMSCDSHIQHKVHWNCSQIETFICATCMCNFVGNGSLCKISPKLVGFNNYDTVCKHCEWPFFLKSESVNMKGNTNLPGISLMIH